MPLGLLMLRLGARGCRGRLDTIAVVKRGQLEPGSRAAVSKTVMGLIGPSRVRIPPPPLSLPKALLRRCFLAPSFDQSASGCKP